MVYTERKCKGHSLFPSVVLGILSVVWEGWGGCERGGEGCVCVYMCEVPCVRKWVWPAQG